MTFTDNAPRLREADKIDKETALPVLAHYYDPALPGTARVRPVGTDTPLPVTVSPAVPGQVPGGLTAGSSTGAAANLAGLSVVRINVDGWNTAADLTFETSTDGATWRPLYDTAGQPVTYKVSGTRGLVVPAGDLLRLTYLRARSGVPGTYVNQAAAVTLSYVTAAL